MKVAAKSPGRRALTAEEKRKRDEEYRVEVKEFGLILKSMVEVFNALVILNSALGQAGRGAYLAFPNPAPVKGQEGTVYPLNRKHLRSANARFAKRILELKNYLRVSRRKTRDPVLPESFRGTYIPEFAAPALRTFFTSAPERFGPLHPIQASKTGEAGEALMARLPMVQQGYLLRNTATMLFYVYAHANNLQDAENAQYARPDELMTAAFGGDIPAAFYSYHSGLVDAKGKQKITKIPMENAIANGLIQGPVNTFQIIASLYPPGTTNKKGEDVGFRPELFNTYYYQNIGAANYYSKSALEAFPEYAEIAQALGQENVLAAMLAEHDLVKQVSEEWHVLLEPGRKAQRDIRKKRKDAQKKRERERS